MTTPAKTSPKKGALKLSASELQDMSKRKGKGKTPVNVGDLMQKC